MNIFIKASNRPDKNVVERMRYSLSYIRPCSAEGETHLFVVNRMIELAYGGYELINPTNEGAHDLTLEHIQHKHHVGIYTPVVDSLHLEIIRFSSLYDRISYLRFLCENLLIF